MGCNKPTIPRVFRGTFEWFVHSEVSGSVLLLACTIVALILANSPLAGLYEQVLHTKAGLTLGDASLKLTLHHWVTRLD